MIYRLLVVILSSVLSTSAFSASQTKLARAFNPDMLGVDMVYFEQITGVARNTYGDVKIYKIDNCHVTVRFKDGSINSLRMEVSPKCTFNLNDFFPIFSGGFTVPHNLTFGRFNTVTGSIGQYYADCLESCGNAVDPTVYHYWFGGRANGYLQMLLEVNLGFNDAASLAAGTWQDEMIRVMGVNWVKEEGFNCTNGYNANEVANSAFGSIKISGITIGYDLDPIANGIVSCDIK